MKAPATDPAASLVLRLPDVGNGYRIDSDSGRGRPCVKQRDADRSS
jgi:hypothetical protein